MRMAQNYIFWSNGLLNTQYTSIYTNSNDNVSGSFRPIKKNGCHAQRRQPLFFSVIGSGLGAMYPLVIQHCWKFHHWVPWIFQPWSRYKTSQKTEKQRLEMVPLSIDMWEPFQPWNQSSVGYISYISYTSYLRNPALFNGVFTHHSQFSILFPFLKCDFDISLIAQKCRWCFALGFFDITRRRHCGPALLWSSMDPTPAVWVFATAVWICCWRWETDGVTTGRHGWWHIGDTMSGIFSGKLCFGVKRAQQLHWMYNIIIIIVYI